VRHASPTENVPDALRYARGRPTPISEGLIMGEARRAPQRVLCPSALCREGAVLLGIVDSYGNVGYINPAPTIGREFVEEAHEQGRAPEHRFRFAAPCLETACAHWAGTRCGVIDQAMSVPETTHPIIDPTDSLPRCAVRRECRWFAQAGSAACSVCPGIFNYVAPDSPPRKERDQDRTAVEYGGDDGN
jgi:hypothetical protein